VNTESDERQQSALQRVGGLSGLIYASVPSVVFVIADAAAELYVAIGLAVASALAVAALRALRGEPLQPALSGLLGVGIGALIAAYTGSAKDYFLVGIWVSFVLAIVLVASVLVGRPLVGVIWGLVSGSGQSWRTDRRSRFRYHLATLAFAAVFGARFVVQNWLYDADSTGWLAIARIAMGYPLSGLALLVAVWAVRRSRRDVTIPASH
jgi:hypothetical protein